MQSKRERKQNGFVELCESKITSIDVYDHVWREISNYIQKVLPSKLHYHGCLTVFSTVFRQNFPINLIVKAT